ncbi:hypothetical protein FRC14_003920 [Serendipita sp. 396]|nr:hypothetical protein FRC14_003920 [Serendipita sp. 396]KAG8788434.1 hypothetical protein FRC15_004409 [Serendipita sp. 397]KAG8872909.1 hypothetical protein FRC20_008918 [Serendipita sp. 405]
MSLGLSDREIARQYQAIVSGSGTAWMVLSYDRSSNDLKVQASGDDGLEEMAEEFMDSRMQYGFIRVKDPNTQLPKFVQINWCGDGVPENRKGHFYTHSTAVSKFLQGTHVVINARNESDLDSALIMKRVNDSSGSKYSVHNEKPRAAVPITPVGTSYTPIGQPDIQGMRSGRSPITPSRSVASTSAVPSAATTPNRLVPPSTFPPPSRTGLKTTTPSWDEEESQSKPVPTLISSAPPPPAAPPAAPPAVKTAAPPKLHVATDKKPQDDDLIAPVGTNYVPVNLPQPKKLVNPFAARQAEAEAEATRAATAGPSKPSGGAKKLTWTERQALAKKQAEEEEAKSKAASEKSKAVSGAGKLAVLGAAGATVGIGIAAAAAATTADAPPPPPPPAPPAPPRQTQEEYEDVPPAPAPAPPPPPPPPIIPVAVAQPKAVEPESEHEVDYPPSHDEPSETVNKGAPKGTIGKVAVVLYDYEATEDGEMSLVEGEFVDQIEEMDEGWWQGVAVSDKNRTGVFPANYVEIVEAAPAEEAEEKAAEPEYETEAPPPPAPAPPPPPPPPIFAAPAAKAAPELEPEPEPASDGTSAKALYDYEAAEPNEVSFAEGDRIINISAASEDWWEGTVVSSGETGLFPANYVELD